MRIDPHVHLRDGDKQGHKETLHHGFTVAWNAGLSAVFEMPNTDPPLTDRQTVENRIRKADRTLRELNIPLFHGIIAGLTGDGNQIREVVGLRREYFPRVCGLKMYAGHSTGHMGITAKAEQEKVYSVLTEEQYEGVLMVHCEKEERVSTELFDPDVPASHCRARPPEAEVESVSDQIRLAAGAGFRGTLHICHISVPEAVYRIEQSRPELQYTITCGITPHHTLLTEEDMINRKGRAGLLLKMNPPLRPEAMRREMAALLLEGRITWIESDHAPHTVQEKLHGASSGIPVLQFYADFLKELRKMGASEQLIDNLTRNNIIDTFGIDPAVIPPNSPAPVDHRLDYGFDPFA